MNFFPPDELWLNVFIFAGRTCVDLSLIKWCPYISSFLRFPDAFVTFKSFKSRFPEVSGYCHCADSLGRELAETGKLMVGREYKGEPSQTRVCLSL